MINDAFGHRIGEEIIIKSALILEELMGILLYLQIERKGVCSCFS